MEWNAILLLGAYHGINPGMGWLFAVALGMQERSRGAVWRALLPLGLGHGLAIGVAVLAVSLMNLAIPQHWLRWFVAGLLLFLGTYRLIRNRHPCWGGMRVGMAGLTLWSFFMASVHGAGLMVLPFFLGMAQASQASVGPHAGHAVHASGNVMTGLLAAAVHSFGYLLVTALVALVVFEKFGLGLLRRAWINLDLVWACALIVTGGAILLF